MRKSEAADPELLAEWINHQRNLGRNTESQGQKRPASGPFSLGRSEMTDSLSFVPE
jgi:hypothetical protein